MDAIKLLKDDHKKVKDLFREYEAAGDRAYQTKKRIAEQVFMELEVHSAIEEEIFYPAVREKAGKEGKELVAEGYEEHHVVETLMQELKALDPEDEAYDAKFKVLTENVEHHIEEEEQEMMPEAEDALGERVTELGEQMLRRKEALMAQMGSRA
jgi:hemerythrin-like domain-containing protein